MDSIIDLNDMEMDALKEVGNVGVGNAATALSKILNKKIDINIPETTFIPITEFSSELGGAEKIVTGIYLKMEGDLDGETIFLFSQESAMRLVDLMMGQEPGTTKTMGEMEISAFKEMSNIFSGAYLSALANMVGMSIFPGIPHISSDMLQSIIDMVLITIANYANNVLCVKTKISIENKAVEGEFVMIFNASSLKKLIDTIHSKYGLS